MATERLTSTHLPGSAHTPSHTRHGKFAYPIQAVQCKEKRCLETSRKEYVEGPVHIGVGSYQVRRYTSADGRLYFGYEQFLSPNILTDTVVFLAFLNASRELTSYFTGQNTRPGRFEVVIALQCVSFTKPQFSYYFVDHNRHMVSDESILIENRIDNCGILRWNAAAYWDHISIFSAHRLCVATDYDRVQILLLGLQTQASVSFGTQSDYTPNDLDVLRDLLSQLDRTNIDKHTTASIAKIMKQILAPPPAPKACASTSLGSTILRSLRGIILPEDPCKNEDRPGFDENSEDDAHPTVHEGSFEYVALLSENDS